jgi:hypothetical protein
MSHYSEDELEGYLHGDIGVIRRMLCSSHLAKCKNCKAMLDELKTDDVLIEELRISVKHWQGIPDRQSPLMHLSPEE